MFTLDIPNMPPQQTSAVMIVQNNQDQQRGKNTERVIGVCEVVVNDERRSPNGELYKNSLELYPLGDVGGYLQKYEQRNDFLDGDWNLIKTTILSQPKHGTLSEVVVNGTHHGYRYEPNAGFFGKDSTVIQVEGNGVKAKVLHYLHVLQYPEYNPYDEECGKTGSLWKISSTPNANPAMVVNSITTQAAAIPSTHKLGVMLVAKAASDTIKPRQRVAAVCMDVAAGEHDVHPEIDAESYYANFEGRTHVETIDLGTVKVQILQAPKHGTLTSIATLTSVANANGYRYQSNPNYAGQDSFVLLVSDDRRHEVRLQYYLGVENPEETVPPYHYTPKECKDKLTFWQISIAPTFDLGNLSWDYSLGISFVPITFTNLTGAAIGSTQGEGTNATITLDADAAGHGWYIDYTPYLNEEFLPTSNPYEWIAKADSDAAGKMELLSVLLHEYGHALGMDHSLDSHDFMGTTLTPGMRRLPTSDELTLMAQRVAEARQNLAGLDNTVVANTAGDPKRVARHPANSNIHQYQ